MLEYSYLRFLLLERARWSRGDSVWAVNAHTVILLAAVQYICTYIFIYSLGCGRVWLMSNYQSGGVDFGFADVADLSRWSRLDQTLIFWVFSIVVVFFAIALAVFILRWVNFFEDFCFYLFICFLFLENRYLMNVICENTFVFTYVVFIILINHLFVLRLLKRGNQLAYDLT